MLHLTAHKHAWLTCEVDDLNKKLISHHDFRKASSMALLDQTGKYHRLERFGNSINEESIASTHTEELSVESYDRNSTKCIRITENSMNPEYGMLNVRLVKSLNHLCQPAEGRNTKCCALHRYETGRQIRGQLLRCEICNAFLCSSCFGIFHKERDPAKIKRQVKRNMAEYDKKHQK